MRARPTIALVVGIVALLGILAPADAAAEPAVTLDRSAVGLGDKVLVTLHDWPTQESVAISLCGNAAARGSIDCDLTNSLGRGIYAAQPVQAVLFRVTPPPMPCPCVIHVTNTTQSLTAFAPIEILGFPTAPVVGNTFESPLAVSMRVRKATQGLFGWVKSSLGGPTTYDLTVVVRNTSAEDVSGVRLTGRVGRTADDQARLVRITPPDVLPAGKSWTHTEEVTLAAPVAGRFVWNVTAAGAGPVARDQVAVHHWPLLLILMILVLVGDVAMMIGRRIEGRRQEARAKRELAERERALLEPGEEEASDDELSRKLLVVR
jgi:hypothetical protein